MAFSPNGKYLASAGYERTGNNRDDDNTIHLWDWREGKVIRTFTGHSDVIYLLAFSPDGNTLATGSKDKTIKLWDVNTGGLLYTLEGAKGGFFGSELKALAFSPDGNILASGDSDKSMKLWNFHTGKLLNTLSDNSGGVWSITFSSDSQTLISGSGDGTIKIWRIKNLKNNPKINK